MGVVEILAGIAMCFFGSKFIFWVLRGLIFLGVNLVIWAIVTGLNLITLDSSAAKVIGLGVVGVALGLAAAYFLGIFAEQYMFAILAGFGAACLVYIVLGQTKMKSSIKTVTCVLTGVVAGYFCKENNKYIKSLSTGFIGAFLLMKGIGEYAGGFPATIDTI